MSIIKEATKEIHEDLELLAFNQRMFRGEQTAKERALYLKNWHTIFSVLDKHVPSELQRMPSICYDLDSLQLDHHIRVPPTTFFAEGYGEYLSKEDVYLAPHIYVNYMGLLYGGQIMKKRYPQFTTDIYDFYDLNSSREYIRNQIIEETDEFIIETKHAFRWHIAMSVELAELSGIDLI